MQIGETWILFQPNPKSSFSKSCRKTGTASTLSHPFCILYQSTLIQVWLDMTRYDEIWHIIVGRTLFWQFEMLANKQSKSCEGPVVASQALNNSQQLSATLNNSQHLSTRFPMSWFLRIQSKKCNNRKQTFHVCEGPLVVGSVTVLKSLNLLPMKLQIKCLRIQLGKNCQTHSPSLCKSSVGRECKLVGLKICSIKPQIKFLKQISKQIRNCWQTNGPCMWRPTGKECKLSNLEGSPNQIPNLFFQNAIGK